MRYLILWVLSFVCVALTADGQNVALADVQKLFNAHDYRGALSAISRTLFADQPLLTPAQRYELFMIRGESFLQLGERPYSTAAFLDAARVAPERLLAVTARANATIVRLATGTVYRPGGNPEATGIDILNSDSRKQAMQAAFADMLKAVRPQVAGALKADSLGPMQSLYQTCIDLYCLEESATGKSTELEPMLTSLGDHAYKIFEDEKSRLGQAVEHYRAIAMETDLVQTGYITSMGHRGLFSQEKKEFRVFISEIEEGMGLARSAGRIARQFGRSGQRWAEMFVELDSLHEHAEQIMALRPD
ncbi:MAG: hypothetical protein ABSH20_15335 [Tepidisphaeraceae bacterium]